MPSLSGRGGLEGAALGPLGLSEVAWFSALRARFWSGKWVARGLVVAAGMVVFFHGLDSIVFPLNGSLHCLGIGGCYGVAAIAAYRVSRRSARVMRVRWRLLAFGLGFGMLAVTLPLYQESVLQRPDPAAEIQDVALLLRGLPFLAAVCLTRRELGWWFVWLDVAQFLLAAFLGTFAVLFAGPHHTAVSSDVTYWWIAAANVLAASLASVRCFGGSDLAEKNFFRLVTGFLWAMTLTTGWLNNYSASHADLNAASPIHLICDVPLLVLTVVLARRRTSRAKTSYTDGTSLVDTVCSMFIPVCSLLLAALIVPTHPGVGLAGVAAGFGLYGLRSAVVLKKSLAAQHELLLANRSIQDQAFSDALTGIPNRRSFDLTLEREWKRAQRSRQPLALLMLDVDHFKALNDKHGHLIGDECLRKVAGVLRAGLGREADFVARYGGEEFAILLVDTGIEGGRIVGESLRRGVEQLCCVSPDGDALSFTVSAGVAAEIPMQHESSVTLVAAADKALYRAKRSGRNRVELHAWQTESLTIEEVIP